MHRSRCNTALSMAIAVCSTYATDRSRDAMTVTSPLILGPNARAARPDGAALQFLFEELPPQHLADQGLRQLRADSTCLGTLNFASRCRQYSRISVEVADSPSFSTTKALIFSPRKSWGMPTTQASLTFGCAQRHSSTSRG